LELEAAAMRDALQRVGDWCEADHICEIIDDALSGDAGRVLVERVKALETLLALGAHGPGCFDITARVSLLEAVVEVAYRAYDEPDEIGKWWFDLGEKLAALDESK
jgi:hypothetical protein